MNARQIIATGCNCNRPQGAGKTPNGAGQSGILDGLANTTGVWRGIADMAARAPFAQVIELAAQAVALTEEEYAGALPVLESRVDNGLFMLDEYEATGNPQYLIGAEEELAAATAIMEALASLFAAWEAARTAMRQRLNDLERAANEDMKAALAVYRAQLEDYAAAMGTRKGSIFEFIENVFGTEAAEKWEEAAASAGTFAKGVLWVSVGLAGAAILIPLGVWSIRRVFR